MKKVLAIIMILLLLTGCTGRTENNKSEPQNGVWISFSEVNSMLTSEKGFKTEFGEALENLEALKIQNLYIHVRAFCDSIFESDYFPLTDTASGCKYDVFKYIIDECHAKEIKVHAWINPYRVSTATADIDKINSASPAYKWLKDDNTENDCNVSFSNGIYLNPAEAQVQALVIDGVREIIAKYDVDGIHFDDYFYPTTNEDFDSVSYAKYIKQAENPLPLADWRRFNVNALISGVYNAIKYANKDIIFSVSPMASIEHNYNNLYADVSEWIKGGYIDYIIPQLYFGFEYPDASFKFENLLAEWKKLTHHSNVGLLIGLASYKAVPELEADKAEWENNFDIIARQAEICTQDNSVKGYVLFSYSSAFGQARAEISQRENLLKYINTEDINE